METNTSLNLIDPRFAEIKWLCQLRDKRYTTKFYGQPYYQIIEPLIYSILPDGGIPCFIGEGENPLPESAATCLLALHRLGLIDQNTLSLIQEYLFHTNAEVVRLQSKTEDLNFSQLNVENCAWSASDGKNVWSTSQVLWALIGTRYDDIYKPVISGAVDWLLGQQYKRGGWALVACKENTPNVFLTSMTIYVLELSLRYESWPEPKQRRIHKAIESGCKYLIESRKPGKPYWTYDPGDEKDSIEPTSTAMAIWALCHCVSKQHDIERILEEGIKALKKDLHDRDVWDNKVIVDGFVPETGLQKVLQGFTPSIALILLRLGVDPTDPMIIKSLNLLLNIRSANGWEFYSTTQLHKSATGYLRPQVHYVGSGETMTFTTALALWTVEEWHRQLLSCNLLGQMEAGNIRLRLTKQQTPLAVQRPHLVLLLTIAGVSVIGLYFMLLNLLFKQSLLDLFVNLSIKDFSDLVDSLLKLLLVPITICYLLVDFYFHGKFSFNVARNLWQRLF